MAVSQGRRAMLRHRKVWHYCVRSTQATIAFCGIALVWLLLLGGARVERYGISPLVPLAAFGFMISMLVGFFLVVAGPPPVMPKSRGLVARDRPSYWRVRALRDARSPPRLPGP